MDGIVAAVLSLFFLIGIAVGIITVIALSVRRAHEEAEDRPDGPDFPGNQPHWP